MSILTFAIADQLADDACGPYWGAKLRHDTRVGRIARAARSAAASALIRHLGDVPPGEWHYAAPGFEERLAVARSVASTAFEAEVEYLRSHGA
jgi:hypothetical protein